MASKSKAQNSPAAKEEARNVTQALELTHNTNNDKLYRIQGTGYKSPGALGRVSKLRQSNQVFLIPYDKMFQEFQHIHRRGEIITSVTPVEKKPTVQEATTADNG